MREVRLARATLRVVTRCDVASADMLLARYMPYALLLRCYFHADAFRHDAARCLPCRRHAMLMRLSTYTRG